MSRFGSGLVRVRVEVRVVIIVAHENISIKFPIMLVNIFENKRYIFTTQFYSCFFIKSSNHFTLSM